MAERGELGGRAYAQVYRVGSGRGELHAFLLEAVRRSGAEVLFASDSTRAPMFLGLQAEHDEPRGPLLPVPLQAGPSPRPLDEHRVQVR